MSPTAFDLDIDVVPATDPSLIRPARPEDAREVDEKSGLTPGTRNTYAVGIAACVPCC
ncbi:hypothetical protein ACIA49_03095 [Kribbella sp. NPDC051587]|jgi:hypothetical protein|uniref:hypothetical protein n=1 Tax=Kribbella sp. NPDC051587 TaxID=3364119 RepID=UPI00379EA22C